MPANDPWSQIQTELEQLLTNEDYRPFRPLLESLQRMVNAKFSLEAARGLLRTIQELIAERDRGINVRERVEQIAGGFIEPSWNVLGDVNQANRDYVNTTIITIFQNAEKELELPEPDPKIRIPFVLLVMTAVEAQELVAELAFNGYPAPLRSDFKKLRRLLEREQVSNWVQRYRDTPENWQPFSPDRGAATIEYLVNEALNGLTRDEGYKPALAAEFLDIRTLNMNRHLLRHLRVYGCVVIMDSISMRHPVLQRAFHQSVLDAYPKTSVVTIAPVAQAFEVARKLSVVLQFQLADMEFAKRRIDRFEEYGACKEISDRQEFEQWLLDRVRKMGLPTSAEPGILPHMRIQQGSR